MLKGNIFVSLALCTLLFIRSAAGASTLCDKYPDDAASQGILYSIKSSAAHESYLFGSLHVGLRKLHILPETALRALLNAKKFYLESLWTDDEVLANRLAMWYLPDGKTLKAVLNKSTYARLQKHLDVLKVSNETRFSFERQTPAAAFSFFAPRSPELDGSDSLDDLLVTAARDAKLNIDGLETQREGMAGLQSISEDDWSAYANDMLDIGLCHACAEERTALITCMAEFVRLGKADELFSMYENFNLTHPAQATILQKTAFSRNPRMAEEIALLIEKGQPVFISIGALHMGGDIGVVNRLRKMGYSVEQIK